MVAAALARPPCERQQRAIGGEIAGGVVAGGAWKQRRAVGSALMQNAGDRLRDLLPAGAVTERAIGAEAADGNIDETRPQRRQLLRPEAELRERARPIALREHIRLLDESLQECGVLGV